MEEIQKNEEDELLSSLPKKWAWGSSYLYNYQGFWYAPEAIPSIVACQEHFEAQNLDTIVVTFPKTGTTWLKALSFATLTRAQYAPSQSPLLTSNPHDLVPFLEYKLYRNYKQNPDLAALPSPRIFGTHISYPLLPNSIHNSSCRIVYVCRNPFDTFGSYWHFLCKRAGETLPLEECFDDFCQGIAASGPFFEHLLGYWKQSLDRPDKVLFLTYEGLKEDISTQIKRLAEFLGCPFSLEEERDGVIEEISKLCSFNMLKDMEHNKKGRSIPDFENQTLFRKGEVGDWINLLTPEMKERLSNIMEEKLAGSGFVFKIRP